jgi:hypothetical protein
LLTANVSRALLSSLQELVSDELQSRKRRRYETALRDDLIAFGLCIAALAALAFCGAQLVPARVTGRRTVGIDRQTLFALAASVEAILLKYAPFVIGLTGILSAALNRALLTDPWGRYLARVYRPAIAAMTISLVAIASYLPWWVASATGLLAGFSWLALTRFSMRLEGTESLAARGRIAILTLIPGAVLALFGFGFMLLPATGPSWLIPVVIVWALSSILLPAAAAICLLFIVPEAWRLPIWFAGFTTSVWSFALFGRPGAIGTLGVGLLVAAMVTLPPVTIKPPLTAD